MKRALLAAGFLALIVAVAVTVGTAAERRQQAPAAAQQVAPGPNTDKAAEAMGGCLPDGSCCGKGECAHAAAGAEKPAAGEAAGGSAGGCPCMKNKKAQ